MAERNWVCCKIEFYWLLIDSKVEFWVKRRVQIKIKVFNFSLPLWFLPNLIGNGFSTKFWLDNPLFMWVSCWCNKLIPNWLLPISAWFRTLFALKLRSISLSLAHGAYMLLSIKLLLISISSTIWFLSNFLSHFDNSLSTPKFSFIDLLIVLLFASITSFFNEISVDDKL